MSVTDTVAGSRRELFGRGSVYTLASAVQAGSALLILPLVTRLLDPSDYGLVATATVVAQLLAVLASLGLNGAVMLEYFTPDGPARARRLVGIAGLVALVVVALADATSPIWASGFAELSLDVDLRLAIWSAAPLAVLAASQAMLRSRRRPFAFVVATCVATVGGYGLGALLVVLTDGGATAYLAGVLIGAGAGAAIGLACGGVSGPRRTDGPLFRSALRVGLPLVPHVVALFALLAADRLLIERILGLGAAGRYQVAYLIGGAAISLLVAVNNAWSPMIIGAPAGERWRLLASTTRDLERLVPGLFAGVALLAPILVALAAPGEYDPADLAPVTVVVAMSVLPFLWYLSAVHVVFFHRRTGVLARTTPTATVFALVGNLLVLRAWGLMGAAVVTVASYAFLAWRVRRAAARIEVVPWDHAVSVRAAVELALVAALALALPTTGLWLAARGGAVVIIASVGCWRVWRGEVFG